MDKTIQKLLKIKNEYTFTIDGHEATIIVDGSNVFIYSEEHGDSFWLTKDETAVDIDLCEILIEKDRIILKEDSTRTEMKMYKRVNPLDVFK